MSRTLVLLLIYNVHCRWPAIICPDPEYGVSAFKTVDGDTLSYHVEFLGTKHSHGLVKTAQVTPYRADTTTARETAPQLPPDLRHKMKGPKVL